MPTGHSVLVVTDAPTYNLGRLPRGRAMMSKRGHGCVYQPTAHGYWECGHHILISAIDARAAQRRAQIATAQQPGRVSADETGRSVDVAPTPASEMPACPTTAQSAAGGHSEAFARAS